MGTTILFTEEKTEKITLRQCKKHIESLPEEEKKEIKNLRKKIKRMSEKCQT